ncbi:MAG: hypothetical protein JNL32_09410, partial [Candidatus Kapabacteria bacterium]|nr:hypothetical protein [Candidatus Kapabacteria bacterium]
KTSRHNTLRQKLATLTNGTTSVTPATWNLQILKTSYTGAELFDPFDVEYQTVELGTNNVTNTYPIPALITYNAWSRTSQWHRDYVNPMIYEAIDWMRYTLGQSRMMSRRRTYWEDAIQRNETFMDAPATERGISDGEISSVANPAFARSLTMMQRLNFSITTTRSGSGIGISGGSVTRRANQWDIDYVQPAHIGFLDFGIARTSAARLVASYCGGGDVGFDARTCARLRQIATQTWRYPESIRPSRYDFILYYNYCRDPDAGMNGIERLYFTY